uniref:Serine aminopeptidase S33 domain-containing protein n=1 Tax=Clastoptera arizonana TaxID=38151 RepID=A0A1B6DNQ5_9HEMI
MIAMKFCKIFCCPPCKTDVIEKLAFNPPSPSTYFLEEAQNGECFLRLEKETKLYFYKKYQKYFSLSEFFYAETKYGNRIACMYMRLNPGRKLTLFYSHENASDLGNAFKTLGFLGIRLGCNVFSYDYSGYGMSTGVPSEKNVYGDAEAAYDAMLDRYGLSDRDVVLYGRSIGSVPTVDLASKTAVAGVVLESGLCSACRVIFKDPASCCDSSFNTIDKVPKVTSPVLVIHGTEDEVIDFSHGLAIYERCPRAVEPLWVEGAGHNDVELYTQYLERLKQFVSVELLN